MGLGAGFAALIVAACCNGTFGVLHKQCRCSNELFCAYFCLGGFLVSMLTLPFLPLLDKTIEFSPLGFPSGFSQFFAINCVFFTIDLAGVAVIITVFAGGIVLASATLENIVILGIMPTNDGLFVLALCLIMVGLAGVFVSRRVSDLAQEAAAELQQPQPTAIGDAILTVPDDIPITIRMSAGRRLLLIGLGTCGVTVGFIMIKLWERLSDGVTGLRFTWSFGVGLLSSALFVPFLFRAHYRRWPAKADFGRSQDLLAGVASGFIWGLGNAGIDLAIGQGVALGTANSIFQLSTIVAGLWGVYFKELISTKAIAIFFAASTVFLAGIFLEALYGGSPDDGGSGDSR